MQLECTYTDLMTMLRGVNHLREEANRKTYENDANIKKAVSVEKREHLMRLQEQYYQCKDQIDTIYYKLKEQIDQID